jgi:hypothetical protein
MQICNTDVEYYINLGLLLYMYRKKYEKRLSDPPLFQGSFHPWLQMRASIALHASLIQSPVFSLMQICIRVRLFTLMQIRILRPKMMRIRIRYGT